MKKLTHDKIDLYQRIAVAVIFVVLLMLASMCFGDEIERLEIFYDRSRPVDNAEIVLALKINEIIDKLEEKKDEEDIYKIPIVQGPIHAGHCSGCYYNADTHNWECSKS